MATTTNFGWETPDDTDLVKDGAAAIRTSLNGVDTSFVDLLGGTTGQVLSKASGTDLDLEWITPETAGGKVAQVLSTTKTDTFTTSSGSYVDITGLSVSITPTASTSKILVIVNVTGNGTPGTNIGGVKLVRDSTDIAYPTSFSNRLPGFASPFTSDVAPNAMASTNFLDSPATTSATTYKVQARTASGSGTIFINRGSNDGDNSSTVRTVSTITVMEILA